MTSRQFAQGAGLSLLVATVLLLLGEAVSAQAGTVATVPPPTAATLWPWVIPLVAVAPLLRRLRQLGRVARAQELLGAAVERRIAERTDVTVTRPSAPAARRVPRR